MHRTVAAYSDAKYYESYLTGGLHTQVFAGGADEKLIGGVVAANGELYTWRCAAFP